ncbi:hypothetical protein SAMN05444413_105102 [Roseivivax marinus]|uniref:phosphoadenosine phosphosulfate reductase n=1 Tax=Roseivivax marinus TaxID=1379903 RepID=UPI0008CD83CC|nr:phosphoadenosine phosphosulfate reductase [Roseivivax marinus]SEL03190.1 hypothetical protein SAMN05444413_105102 [Roseivivax marinus]
MPNDDDRAEDLLDLAYPDWVAEMKRRGEAHGFYEPLGQRHHAHFLEAEGDTLLVTFETFPGIRALSDTGLPLGQALAETEGWSHLALVSSQDTWFRESRVYGFFDQLNDDGFFDEFDRILFYGAGSCGYAACAFSVAAPGARVLALHPQATLDPRMTEWDDRFTLKRRTSFTNRYGYAPDMLDAATRATILYDPREPLDAMHSALFARRNVQRFRMPSMGGALQGDIVAMGFHGDLVRAAMQDTLDTPSFARMLRARRGYGGYLRRLLARLEQDERTFLVKLLCRNVSGRMRAPRFRRRLQAIEAAESDRSSRPTPAASAED